MQQWKVLGSAVVVLLLGSLMMIPVPAQNPEQEQESAREAGLFKYAGGTVKGKRAITQTAATTIAESATWVNLPNASIPWVVPPGTPQEADLFNVAFSAETRLFNGGGDDYVRIRILDNGVPLEPYDGFQAFFDADSYATHKGNWVKRALPGNHNLTVQFWIFDGAPAEVLTASIDDWTFELVVYD